MGPLTRFTLLLAALSPSLVAADVPPSIPQIKSIAFSGNGCKATPKYSGGLNDLKISYTTFAGRIPADGSGSSANCEVNIQASGGTPGWQFALQDLWATGHVWLQPGTSLDYYTTAYFSQSAAATGTDRDKYTNSGGDTVNEDVTLHSNFAGKQVWSPCLGSDGYTGIFNVNFRGALIGDNRASFETYNQRWALEWRRC